MTPERAAEVRYYFDADVLGLAKILVQLRSDCTYPGDPGGVLHKRRRAACVIASTATPDSEWIPTVASHGWLIITRDSRIQAHRAEIEAVRRHNAKMIALVGKESTGVWSQLAVLLNHWPRIEAAYAEPGPFIYAVTRSAFRAVPLD